MLSEQDLASIIATPATLGKYVGPHLLGRPYKAYPWIRYMEQRIITMLNEPGRKILVISVPSQQGKTTYAGLLLPAWYLGHNPGRQVMFISYSTPQAAKWGLRTRALIRQFGQQLFGVATDSDSEAKANWTMSNGFGGMMCAGISAGIQGNPGDLIIIDDVIGTKEDANSPTVKAKHLEEFDGSITSRFQENTKVLITATRQADDDLSGELILRSQNPETAGGTPVEVLNIKALAEPDPEELEQMSSEELAEWTDFLGRHYGEGLKGQHSQTFFEELKANNLDNFMKMHQGTPTSRRGGMFPVDKWGYWTYGPAEKGVVHLDPNEIVNKVRVWDLASSADRGADFTVGTLMGRTRDNRFFVLDRVRFQKNADDTQAEVVRVAKEDTNRVQVIIEQSKNGDGAHVLNFYEKLLIGFNVEGVTPKGDKTARATGYSAEQNKGNVYLPANAPWLRDWRNEHVQMDGKGRLPKHDDQIDTGAYAFNYLWVEQPSTLWDPTQLPDPNSRPDLTPEQRMEYALVRQAMGVG